MKLSAKQTQAYKLALSGTKQIILYGGAIRGGKTYWLLLTFISLCSKYPKSRWVIIRKSLPTLKQTTFVTFQTILESGLQPHIRDWNKDTQTVTFNNGSQIIFMSESYDEDKDLNRFRGLEINGAGVDELNEVQQVTFHKLIERSGSWQNQIGKAPIVILCTCNPSQGWVKDDFYDRWVSGELPDSWEYIPAKITDNPYVEQDYLDSLKRNMPPDDYAKFVEGDWNIIKVANPFFTWYNPEKHDGPVSFDPKRQLIISMDFNLNPFGVLFSHVWQDQSGWHWHTFDEAEIEHGSVQKMIELILTKYRTSLYSCKLTGDFMGNRGDIGQRDNASLYQQLMKGLNLHASQVITLPNPTHENSRADCNYVLWNFPDVRINPVTCPGLKRDLRMVQCDAYGAIIKKDRKDINQRADLADCFRYIVNNILYDWIKTHQKINQVYQFK